MIDYQTIEMDKNLISGTTVFLLTVFLTAAIVVLSGCSGNNDSPEQQVLRFVAGAEEAAEKRDAGAIKKLIADNYSDDRNQTKLDLVRVVAGYFLRNKNIHFFTHIGDLQFPEPDVSKLQLFVAMAGQPIPEAEILFDIRADLYLFDLTLSREKKEWLLISSSWRPAVKEDFFPRD